MSKSKHYVGEHVWHVDYGAAVVSRTLDSDTLIRIICEDNVERTVTIRSLRAYGL